MHPRFLSNAYVVADAPGGTAFFVDSGAPLEPLLEAVERDSLTVTHLLRTHSHADHVEHEDELVDRFGLEVVTGSVESGPCARRRCRPPATPTTASRSSSTTCCSSRATRSSATRSAAAPPSRCANR